MTACHCVTVVVAQVGELGKVELHLGSFAISLKMRVSGDREGFVDKYHEKILGLLT